MADAPTDPAKLDATQSEVKVEYGGNTYVFPASLDDAPFDVLIAIDDEKFSRALRALMRPEDFDTFMATHPTTRDATSLFGDFAKAIGLPVVGE